uniref:Uncharacterized protein n=1 Tax=Opuntia streptacantha TaxID=393608 RepID=A0A7C9DTW7_OPUST
MDKKGKRKRFLHFSSFPGRMLFIYPSTSEGPIAWYSVYFVKFSTSTFYCVSGTHSSSRSRIPLSTFCSLIDISCRTVPSLRVIMLSFTSVLSLVANHLPRWVDPSTECRSQA